MTATDDEVEDETDDGPWYIVHCRSRRDQTCSAEDHREVDVFDEGVGPLQVNEPCSEGAERANEEKVEQSAIDQNMSNACHL